jgi:hypothetical protein
VAQGRRVDAEQHTVFLDDDVSRRPGNVGEHPDDGDGLWSLEFADTLTISVQAHQPFDEEVRHLDRFVRPEQDSSGGDDLLFEHLSEGRHRLQRKLCGVGKRPQIQDAISQCFETSGPRRDLFVTDVHSA